MIDFKKRLVKPSSEKPINPIEIYDRLDRASDKGPLRPAQIAVLEDWHQNRGNERDIILKLNTGQGKTLVGLLMLQSKMNENEGSALYLCPDNFLVAQTVIQAKQFGINCVTAEGDLPVGFLDGKSILVTSVHKLFNGLSKFKLGPQSIPVANVVVDDAHTCIDRIKDSYTIKLASDQPAYKEMVMTYLTKKTPRDRMWAWTNRIRATISKIRQSTFGSYRFFGSPLLNFATFDFCGVR